MINTSKLIDLTGKRFGKLTVLERADDYVYKSGRKAPMWKCECECGNEVIVRGESLREGNTKSCGCINSAEDLTGKVFGRLTVLERTDDNIQSNGHAMWKCRCECGNEVVAKGSHLRRGNTKSCGCLNREAVPPINIKHGFSGERLYRVWEGVVKRCCNKNDKAYHNYGGRGIKICDEWRFDYITFREWAFANGYDENAPRGEYTIDRIDVDGDYEPDNCRWINIREQARNKRNTLKFTYNEEEKSLKEWCEESNLSYDTVYHRLKRGWTFEEALGF